MRSVVEVFYRSMLVSGKGLSQDDCYSLLFSILGNRELSSPKSASPGNMARNCGCYTKASFLTISRSGERKMLDYERRLNYLQLTYRFFEKHV